MTICLNPAAAAWPGLVAPSVEPFAEDGNGWLSRLGRLWTGAASVLLLAKKKAAASDADSAEGPAGADDVVDGEESEEESEEEPGEEEERMRGTTRSLVLALAAAALLGSGCLHVHLADDIDLELNWSALNGPSDSLHLPYVAGTRVTIWARGGSEGDAGRERDDWRLESSDDRVLLIESQLAGSARCVAVAPGTATVDVIDGDGTRIHRAEIEVRAPTRVELLAHGPLLVDLGEDAALVTGPVQVLEGGTATFLARYFDGATRLYGNGVLELAASGGLDARAETTFLFENREWLQLTALAATDESVALEVAGVRVGSLEVVGVEPDAVASVELFGRDESRARDGEWLTVLAQAFDGEGAPIYGVEYQWDVDGGSVAGAGDLYRYEYAADSAVELAATFDGHRAEARIHSGDGYVSSTNVIGCSAVPGGRQGGPAGLALLLLAGLALRVSSPRKSR